MIRARQFQASPLGARARRDCTGRSCGQVQDASRVGDGREPPYPEAGRGVCTCGPCAGRLPVPLGTAGRDSSGSGPSPDTLSRARARIFWIRSKPDRNGRAGTGTMLESPANRISDLSAAPQSRHRPKLSRYRCGRPWSSIWPLAASVRPGPMRCGCSSVEPTMPASCHGERYRHEQQPPWS